MSIFEISIRRPVSADRIVGALSVFFSVSPNAITDHDELFSRAASLREKTVGLRVLHSEAGYRSLVDVVTNFDCDEQDQLLLCRFLAGAFESQVATGDFLSCPSESTGRYLVIEPTGECRYAVEISNGDVFDLMILPMAEG